MKKFKTIFATMILSMGLVASFTSCSGNDDNNDPDEPAAQSIAGTYSGNMTCTVMDSEEEYENMSYVITATDDATVSIILPGFGTPPMQLPDVTLTDLKVTGKDGAYTIAATEFSGTSDQGKAYSGDIKGSFANNTLTLEYRLQYGAMPMSMYCSFSAPKE